jgi:hydroxymethylbilane synthase
MALFCRCRIRKNQLKASKLYQFRLDDSAPQGAMLVVAMQKDSFAVDALSHLNDIETEIVTYIERQFLKTLEGGCTAPIGALARYNEKEDTIHFKVFVFA